MTVDVDIEELLYGDSGTLFGSTIPREFTPPAVKGPAGPCGCGCPLTPATSYGFAVVDFAKDTLNEPLDPWQRWLVIHMGELLRDGKTPRFRKVLIIVARQNGKTHLLKVLALYWQFVEKWRLILGMSSNLEYAKEAWSNAVDDAETIEALSKDLPDRGSVLRGNNDIHMKTIYKSKYKIAAANRRGGRSLSVDRLIIDELREQQNWEAWNASTKATNARPYAQIVCITNQGDVTSVVLRSLLKAARAFLKNRKGDPRLGLFGWTAPPGADIWDRQAWAAANPNLGHRVPVEVIEGDAALAEEGPEEEAGFRTEVMCQEVGAMDPAIDPEPWKECLVPGDLSNLRGRIALGIDIKPGGRAAAIAAAGMMMDGRTRFEVQEDFQGRDAVEQLRAKLKLLVPKIKPQQIGIVPNGPGKVLFNDLRPVAGKPVPFPGVKIVEAEPTGVSMRFSEQVDAQQVLYDEDPMLAHQASVTSKKYSTGNQWRFDGEDCFAIYAAAIAVDLARTMPKPAGKPRLLSVS